MGNDFFQPLLSDAYGLFGGSHALDEGPPPVLEDGLSTSELQQFLKLEPVMRGLLLPFLKTARHMEHKIVLLPTLYGLDDYLEAAAARMDETAHGQLGDFAARLKKPQPYPAHHLNDETKTATSGLVSFVRVAYYDPDFKQYISKKDVATKKWEELAKIGRRASLVPGFYLSDADYALFQDPNLKRTPSREDGIDKTASLKKVGNINPKQVVKAAMGFIQRYEACPLVAYPDPVTGNAPWTIGYGATGEKIGRMTCWTTQKAISDLQIRCEQYLATIFKMVKTAIPGSAFAAIVSFAYNVGLPAFQKSTLLKKLNQRDFANTAKEFEKWTKVQGIVTPQLIARRKEESKLFLSEISPPVKAKPDTKTDDKKATSDKKAAAGAHAKDNAHPEPKDATEAATHEHKLGPKNERPAASAQHR